MTVAVNQPVYWNDVAGLQPCWFGPLFFDRAEVSSIRATLDANGLPYSVLVYGILAALQALHAARLTGTRAGTGLGPATPGQLIG